MLHRCTRPWAPHVTPWLAKSLLTEGCAGIQARSLDALPKSFCAPAQVVQQRCFGKKKGTKQDIVVNCWEKETFALLMDGDCNGPQHFRAALAALEKKGQVVYKSVFATPTHKDNPKWKTFLAEANVDFVPVARKAGGTRGPNDIEIAMQAACLASSRTAGCIALLVNDQDFLLVAKRLRSMQQRVMVLLPRGQAAGLARAFEEQEAKVVWLDLDETEPRRPTRKAILKPDGSGLIVPMSGREDMRINEELLELFTFLQRLGYLEDGQDPLMPAIAKCLYANNLGPVTVWPLQCAQNEFKDIIASAAGKVWLKHPGNFAFVLPQGNQRGSKHHVVTYGTVCCKAVAEGEGPFILHDSAQLVEELLTRLGYLDSCLNPDVEEAFGLFCSKTANKRALNEFGVRLASIPTACGRHALFRGIVLS
ncbi:unnamed protein product [Polarella glacialis]|uniref:NYN domain-containing protein n=1 Tax=Polarella glacialis TaxID=89957 RepID=A0A813HER7_POLGL|nr:unnamed protein product [Polarella glacialis]